ncbi:hypothetical protein BBP40_003940 [Aspergillus hancockii]|nr:hypothetical protein BBP40_003940 [Aspergillus hancockii]
MNLDLPSVSELKRAAECGQRITPADAWAISETERKLSGEGPITGGAAATAQCLAMRQMEFDAKMDELSSKPQSHITREDARQIELAEARAFNKTPGLVSVSAQVRSIADRNEALGLPPVLGSDSAFVTKDEAKDAQQAEAQIYGGQNPRGGMAAQMQSVADKLENAKRGSE